MTRESERTQAQTPPCPHYGKGENMTEVKTGDGGIGGEGGPGAPGLPDGTGGAGGPGGHGGQGGTVRLTRGDRFLRATTFALVVSLALGFFGVLQNQRGNCTSRQRQYDGLVHYTAFLGEEFHATPAQVAQGTKDFRRMMGARPKC